MSNPENLTLEHLNMNDKSMSKLEKMRLLKQDYLDEKFRLGILIEDPTVKWGFKLSLSESDKNKGDMCYIDGKTHKRANPWIGAGRIEKAYKDYLKAKEEFNNS